jgi:hypothetical protein
MDYNLSSIEVKKVLESFGLITAVLKAVTN